MIKNKKINLLQGYLVLVEFFIISTLLYLPFFILKENTTITDSAITNLIAYILIHIILIIYLKKKYSIDYLNFSLKNVEVNSTFLLTTFLLTIILYFLIYPATKFLENNIDFFKNHNVKDLHNGIFFFLNILVFAPLLEEIIFRKILFTGLNKTYGVFVSLVNSSLIFSIIHFDFLQSFEAFFGGLLIGWIYYKTKSILYPVIAHFLHNLFFAIDKTYFSNNFPQIIYDKSIPVNLLFFIFFLVALILLISNLNLISKSKENRAKQNLEILNYK